MLPRASDLGDAQDVAAVRTESQLPRSVVSL